MTRIGNKRSNGEGSVFYDEKRDRWVAAVTVGWGANGKRRTLSRSFKTRKEAGTWLNARLTDREEGRLVEPNRLTVAGFLNSWLEDWARTGVGPRSFETYSFVCRKYIVPAIGSVRLASLTAQHLQRLYNEKTDAGHSRTALMVHSVLHRALGQAVKWGLLKQSPAEAVDVPCHRCKEGRSLTREQAVRFLDAAKEDRLAALFILALSTGLRQGELLGLAWSDLDLKEGTLQVRRSLAWVGGSFRFLSPKTERSCRTVGLSAVALAAVKRHRAAQAAERLALGEAWWAGEFDLVFTTTVGSPIGKSVLTRRDFKPLLAKAGLPDFRFHDLRHTAATLLLAAGENMKTIQGLLGHSRLTTTANVYTHALPDDQRQAADTMNDILTKGGD